ncbi:MAG: hypothetical protein V3T77_11570 [Planctomycetota bacterium]
MRGTLGVAFLLAACVGIPAVAQEGANLTIGDRVPDVQIGHFLKGAPLSGLDEDRTYVLEFWATW